MNLFLVSLTRGIEFPELQDAPVCSTVAWWVVDGKLEEVEHDVVAHGGGEGPGAIDVGLVSLREAWRGDHAAALEPDGAATNT